MAIPVWPRINFMAKQGSGAFSLSDGSNRISSGMDNGQLRVRRRFVKSLSPSSFVIHMNYAEVGLFEHFYLNVIKSGSMWFYMPVQRGSEYVLNLVLIDPRTNPSQSEVGYNAVEITLNLLIRDLNVVSDEVYAYFGTFGTGSKFSIALDRFINVSYPATGEY